MPVLSTAVESLVLHARAIQEIADECAHQPVLEVCGVLLGPTGERVAQRTLSLRNADDSPCAFSVPGYELRRARATAAMLGLSLIGLYHSHPGGSPLLSGGDREGLEASQLPWLIIARDGDGCLELAAYGWPHASPMQVVIRHQELR